MWEKPSVVLITGIMAAGKSTVAELLARRLPRSVHLRGDLFRRMVVGGRAEMTARPSEEAWRQLRLRYELAASVADRYAQEGFTVVLQDVVLGAERRSWPGRGRTAGSGKTGPCVRSRSRNPADPRHSSGRRCPIRNPARAR